MEKDFNRFVSHLVHYHLNSSNKHTKEAIAENLGVSVSFFDKCLHGYEGKHFNLKHLFLIAETLEVSIDNLVPSIKGYSLLHNQELTKEEWKAFVENYKNLNIKD